MEFLNDALFSTENSTLLGALITHFSHENYLERASVRFYTKDELSSQLSSMVPRGFTLSPEGVLLADTNVRHVMSKDVAAFVGSECKRFGNREVDVTDLVLHGVHYGGAVLINAEEAMTGADPILVPFLNYRVSNSSFNIYGAYRIGDGTFRTHSLLELEDGSGKTFNCIFPAEVDMSWAVSMCKPIGSIQVKDTQMTVYATTSFLKPFYTCVGEAFLNFLAFSVAYFNIGTKFLKDVAPGFKDTAEQQEAKPYTKEKRYPKKNVAIEHTYTNMCLYEILELQNEPEKLTKFLDTFPEANLTMNWLSRLVSSPWYQNTDGTNDDKVRAASANLAIECKEYGLKYGLELLTHRYYLASIHRYTDYIPLVLKGGGVEGESIKRIVGAYA